MKKEINYIECLDCKWTIEQQPDFDWLKDPCCQCKNTRQIEDPKDILCNLCGGHMCHDITVASGRWNTDRPFGLYNKKVSGSYESYHLFDMTSYTFSFCEECLRKLFIQCKIPPKVTEYGMGTNIDGSLVLVDGEGSSWEEDLHSYEYRLWCDNGGHHQAYLNGQCNSIKDCANKAAYTLLHNDTKFTENAFCEEHKDRKYFNSTLTKFIPNVLKPFL